MAIGDPTAAWVARVMPGALAQALVEAGRPSAPVSVRIDYVILGPSSGEGGPAGSSPDQPLRAETWYSLSAADVATTAASNYDRVVLRDIVAVGQRTQHVERQLQGPLTRRAREISSAD